MTAKGIYDLALFAAMLVGIPLVLIDGLTIMNELTLIVLVVMSIAFGLRLRAYWPNPVPIHRRTPSLWDWVGAGWVSFIAILLGLGLSLSVLTDDYTALGIVAMGIALCANLRLTIPDWIVAIKATRTALGDRESVC